MRPSILYPGGGARGIFGLPDLQSPGRGRSPGRGMRESCNADGSRGLPASQKKPVSGLPSPIVANTLIIPWVLKYAYGSGDMVWFMMITVGAGEILAVGILGQLLLGALEPYREELF